MRDIIFLIGYMGCGKTTLGEALARRTGVRFVDLDDYIEVRAGMSIREIFATKGEPEFRRMEREALAELSTPVAHTTIVACGGGTPCTPGNMELMNSVGLTVFLQTSVERLVSRLAVARDHRPLIAQLTDQELRLFVEHQLEARMPFYAKAAEVFDSTLLEDEAQVDQTSSSFIRQFLEYQP
ncbi:MAG: AAA family ATPase [Muribaculaceae bacterium]|nr:AAA family ATPase [Muribaculaceae bacterium]